MLIKKHDKSHIVELEDGSRWRIWPGDIAATLQWLPTTELRISEISDKKDSSRVRVIEASTDSPVVQVRRSLKEGLFREASAGGMLCQGSPAVS